MRRPQKSHAAQWPHGPIFCHPQLRFLFLFIYLEEQRSALSFRSRTLCLCRSLIATGPALEAAKKDKSAKNKTIGRTLHFFLGKKIKIRAEQNDPSAGQETQDGADQQQRQHRRRHERA